MSDRFPRKFDVQPLYKPSNYAPGLIFVVNFKFPWATYLSFNESQRSQANCEWIVLIKLLSVTKNGV